MQDLFPQRAPFTTESTLQTREGTEAMALNTAIISGAAIGRAGVPATAFPSMQDKAGEEEDDLFELSRLDRASLSKSKLLPPALRTLRNAVYLVWHSSHLLSRLCFCTFKAVTMTKAFSHTCPFCMQLSLTADLGHPAVCHLRQCNVYMAHYIVFCLFLV